MTFIRKFMDMLNMDNWATNSDTSLSHDYQSESETLNQKFVTPIDLQMMQSFWENTPTYYQDDYKNASIDEYLVYGKTLMLWLFTKASPLRTDFPSYIEHECRISNPQKLQSELLRDLYIEPAPIMEVLKTYKVCDLKIIADSIGCAKTGNKEELINRIYQNLDKDVIHSVNSNSGLFILSDKGRTFLNSNYDYVELHRHLNYGVSLYDYNRNRSPDNVQIRTFNDNIYSLVSQRIYRNCVNRNYYMMERDHNVLYDIAFLEYRYDTALTYYLRSLYIKSCCISQAQYCINAFYNRSNIWSHEVIFTSNSAPPVVKLNKFYSPCLIENIYNDLSLPPSFLTQEEMISMVEEMLQNPIFDYEKYNRLITLRLEQFAQYCMNK